MMTLSDYISSQALPFCSSLDEDVNVKTSEFQTTFTGFMDLSYGSLKLLPKLQENSVKIKSVCETLYAVNKYKYDKLFATLDLEYNPIDNYDMTEVEEVQVDKDNTNTYDRGQETFDKGQETFTKGSQTDSVGGETVTHNASPYDSVNVAVDSSDVSTGHSDTEGQRQDTTSARHDTTSARHDTTVDDGSDHTERELHRHGNIGVMSTQQLIASERETALFNIYKVVAKDILPRIATIVYDGGLLI